MDKINLEAYKFWEPAVRFNEWTVKELSEKCSNAEITTFFIKVI